jgi:hypothetical protein
MFDVLLTVDDESWKLDGIGQDPTLEGRTVPMPALQEPNNTQ